MRSALSSWIQEEHLENEAVTSYRTAFHAHPARFVVINNFLQSPIAARLSDFLLQEAEFDIEHGLYSRDNEAVPEDAWKAAPEADRFFRFSKLVGTPQQLTLSDNALTYLRFRTLFQNDDELRLYFEDVTGLSLSASTDFGSHSMGRGDFLKSHDDDNRNRRLALVLYLTREWSDSLGGNLHILGPEDTEVVVKAEYNSLVAFDTRAGTTHYVEPVADAAGELRRVTIGGWYHDPAALEA